jgi:hypothetical protein
MTLMGGTLAFVTSIRNPKYQLENCVLAEQTSAEHIGVFTDGGVKWQSRDTSVVRPNEDVGSSVHISKFVLVYIANQPSSQPASLPNPLTSNFRLYPSAQQRPALGSSEGGLCWLYEEIKKKLVFGVRKVAEGAFEKVNFSSCARLTLLPPPLLPRDKKGQKRELPSPHSRRRERESESYFLSINSCNLARNCGCKCSAVSFVRPREPPLRYLCAYLRRLLCEWIFEQRERMRLTRSSVSRIFSHNSAVAVTDSILTCKG